ncbi:MAG: hypothetical protein ACFFD8_07460 [Candidatus Thorarchaeota archaeon]
MSEKKSSEPTSKINLDRLFSNATTATFVIQLLTLLVLIAAIVGYLLVLTGIWSLIQYNQDILVFLLLIGGAIAFIIFMAFFGAFIRFHRRVKHFVLGEGVGRITYESRDGQIIISLFAFSVIFFGLAGLYAIYLLWKYFLPSLYALTNSIYPNIIVLTLAILLVTLMIQLASRAVSHYAQNIVARISKEP